VLLGPFLGEVGFELLYWIPAARRLMAEHGIGRERAVALTRGGSGLWYRDFAGRNLEILELVDPRGFAALLDRRRAEAGDSKMLSITHVDRELIAAAHGELGDITVVHPIVMYTRLRWIWQGAQDVADIFALGDYRPLRPPEPAKPLGLPDSYVAFKPYFNHSFPDNRLNRAYLRRLVEQLAERSDIVLLSAGGPLDDHADWRPDGHPRIFDLDGRVEPRSNLAVQTQVVAGARGLVSTYGGFSYLGPFLGVPTLSFHSLEPNPRHAEVLHAVLPDEHFAVAAPGAEIPLDGFLDRAARPVSAR
jgi:hypothetical protein